MRLNIAIVTSGLKFTGATLAEQSLGGSETAALCMAKALAKLGHQVRMFCECTKPGVYDGVQYLHHGSFSNAISYARFDVLIASRWPEFLVAPAQAGLRILWLHDTLVDKNRVMACSFQTDRMFALSDFHIKNYTEQLPELEKVLWKTSNGVDMELIEKNRRPKVPGKVIYTSRPERGLHFLLQEIMPHLIKANPNVKLHYANYDLQGMQVPPHITNILGFCEQRSRQLGDHVVNLGHLTKERLYQEISSAEAWLFPTDFPEVSCIGAMEAQACGTPIISTNNFALKETVGPDCGTLIDSVPQDPSYLNNFVGAVLSILSNEGKRKAMCEAGPKWINFKGYTWDRVAKTWEDEFHSMMEIRYEENKIAVLDELVYRNDPQAALLLSQEEELPLDFVFAPTKLPQEQDAAKDLVESVDRYQVACDLIRNAGIDPKSILDAQCGHSPFALVAKRKFPNATITCVEENITLADRVQRIFEKNKIEGEVLHTYPDGEKFDIVFAGHWIDEEEEPWTVIQTLLSFLNPGGKLIMTTRFGTDQGRLTGVCQRRWSLDFTDFCDMIQREGAFAATFQTKDMIAPDKYELGAAAQFTGYWAVVIDADQEIKPIDLTRRKLVTRPYRRVAACMIVKDEEDNITKCLKALRPYVDKIIVTDTGSTDDTVQLAEKYADEVRHVPFDNFSQVRNESIRDTGCDWTLWLDADEVLSGGDRLRKYTYANLFNGFIIKQHHLMLDLQGTFDVPVRMFRNLPQFKFVGYIHEHAEDTGKGGFDNPIDPNLLLQDINLAHYGYLNERVRRRKCSNRNMALLRRDMKDNPTRMLTKVLACRDYINQTKWHIEKTREVTKGSEWHQSLNAAVACYLQYFADTKHKYHDLIFPMYQDALSILAMLGLPFEDREAPPFQINFALNGAVGSPVNDKVQASTRWFIDHEQMMQFINNKGAELITSLQLATQWRYNKELKKQNIAPFKVSADRPELLSLGQDVIHWKGV